MRRGRHEPELHQGQGVWRGARLQAARGRERRDLELCRVHYLWRIPALWPVRQLEETWGRATLFSIRVWGGWES